MSCRKWVLERLYMAECWLNFRMRPQVSSRPTITCLAPKKNVWEAPACCGACGEAPTHITVLPMLNLYLWWSRGTNSSFANWCKSSNTPQYGCSWLTSGSMYFKVLRWLKIWRNAFQLGDPLYSSALLSFFNSLPSSDRREPQLHSLSFYLLLTMQQHKAQCWISCCLPKGAVQLV